MLLNKLDNLEAIVLKAVPGCWQFGWSTLPLQQKYWGRFKQLCRQKSVVAQWLVGVQSELVLKQHTVSHFSS